MSMYIFFVKTTILRHIKHFIVIGVMLTLAQLKKTFLFYLRQKLARLYANIVTGCVSPLLKRTI